MFFVGNNGLDLYVIVDLFTKLIFEVNQISNLTQQGTKHSKHGHSHQNCPDLKQYQMGGYFKVDSVYAKWN